MPVSFSSRMRVGHRSEEHTSELQSRLHLVCRLLLEKKKKNRRVWITLRALPRVACSKTSADGAAFWQHYNIQRAPNTPYGYTINAITAFIVSNRSS